MALHQSQLTPPIQRLQVGVESLQAGKQLKISVESYDAGLGWYAAGSLSIPLHQLPLLEQALEALRSPATHEPGTPDRTIVPFPGLRVPPEP